MTPRALGAVALAIGATAVVYYVFVFLHARRRSLLTLPILATTVILAVLLSAGVGDFAAYEGGTMPLRFLLGPATLALAVPLRRQRALIGAHVRAILGVVVGAVVGAASAMLLARAAGLSPQLVATITPKSVTTPMAMPISERLGGVPTLTAAIVVLVGVFGAAIGPRFLDRLGVRGAVARGLALGASSHGVGTARALEESETTGAAAGIAMVVAGVVTALVSPFLLR